MPYVVTDRCIGTKDLTCIDVCPVDCIYDGGAEDKMVYIDVDAARAGNEARFLNDFHGVPGIDAPNCQFWPYYDNVTGEKRIGIKTIREVATGQELLVDYGGKYFAADSSDDSDMHESDEEFEVKPKTKKRRLLKGA